MTPFPLILSAPSGGGKTTVARLLLARRSDVGYSVSCTTRTPRAGEVDGKDYHFLSREEFESRREAGDFAESAQVHGNMYGTLRSEVNRVLATGRHVIMDIDVQGARQFAAAIPESVRVFLLPPSADTLVQRLTARRTESAEVLVLRMQGARDELREASAYDYVIVNDELEDTVRRVGAVIDAESVRRARQGDLAARVAGLVAQLDGQIEGLTTKATGS